MQEYRVRGGTVVWVNGGNPSMSVPLALHRIPAFA